MFNKCKNIKMRNINFCYIHKNREKKYNNKDRYVYQPFTINNKNINEEYYGCKDHHCVYCKDTKYKFTY